MSLSLAIRDPEESKPMGLPKFPVTTVKSLSIWVMVLLRACLLCIEAKLRNTHFHVSFDLHFEDTAALSNLH